MTPKHHPSQPLLIDYAAGSVDLGVRLIIATHVQSCADCAREVSLAEGVGGALLDALPPADMLPDALAQALARIERPVGPGDPAPAARPDWIRVSPEVLHAAQRRRRWAAPGVWVAPISKGPAKGESTYLLRVAAGMSMPRHTHRGAEVVCVLKGAFTDGDTVYGPGDFAWSDQTVDHRPVITPDSECVCLTFAQGPLVPRDWVGRVFQPFVGI